MSNSIAPGSSADVNVRVTALTTNPNVPVTYKTIILKKNLVNGVNTLTQEMMSAQNTKYVVKYDYVLSENITVSANCILEFDGGSISGAYTITGNNTGINAGLVKIFNTNITLDGSWNVAESYPEWFGAAPSINSSDAIKKCIECFNKIRFSRYGYIVEKEISFNSLNAKEICGFVLSRGVNGTNEYTLIASNNFIGSSIISINSGSGLKFANLKIKGLGKQENGINGITLGDNTYSIVFEYCTINFCGKGFNIGRCWNLSFIHCIFNQNFFSIYTTGTMTSSSFIDCVFYTSERALYFNGGVVYSSIIDCGFDGCTRGISVYSECSINIINCGWEGYSEYGILGQNVDAKLVLYNSYIQYQEGNVPFVGGYLNIEFHDITFPNGFVYACNKVNFINCSNVPYIGGTEAGQIDYMPIEDLITKQGNTGFVQKGSKLVSANDVLQYIYDRTSSIIYNNYLLLDITILADSEYYNGKIIVKSNGFEITNQDYTSLFTFTKSDTSAEAYCTLTFLVNCRVIINAVGRGVTVS